LPAQLCTFSQSPSHICKHSELTQNKSGKMCPTGSIDICYFMFAASSQLHMPDLLCFSITNQNESTLASANPQCIRCFTLTR